MNDFQNAYETGKMIRYRQQVNYSHEISNVIDSGLFAVVAVTATHCPFTDAATGSARHLVSAHATRAEADAEASRLYDDSYPAEVDYLVLPQLPRPAYVPTDSDTIPF